MGGELPQCRNLTPDAIAKGRENSTKARGLAAKEAYADLQPLLAELRAKGMALQAIASELNAQGHTTRRGKPWNPVQVMRVLGKRPQWKDVERSNQAIFSR